MDIEKIVVKKIIDFAKEQDQFYLHQMVMDWNWDNYNSFLHWLIENPNTDKATILMIYWKYNPSYDFPHKNKLEFNYLNNYYKNHAFYFNPEDDEGDNWVSYLDSSSKVNIPLEMYIKLDGEIVPYPKGFIEGLPESLFYEIEELFD